MLRKSTLVILFVIAALPVIAQSNDGFMHYDPIPVTPPPGAQSNAQPTTRADNSQITNAYIIDYQKSTVTKVTLKVVTTQRGILVAGYKRLTDYAWTNLTLPFTASKVYPGSELAKHFEYEVYIPAFLTKVYF
jgi:hypothetical protein